MSEKKRKRKNSEEGNISKMQKRSEEFNCDICSAIFSNKSTLIRHVLSHNSFYECEHCCKKFKRKDVLQKHKKIHYKQKGGGNDKIEDDSSTQKHQLTSSPRQQNHTYSSNDIASPHHQRHNSTISSKENNDHTYVRERRNDKIEHDSPTQEHLLSSSPRQQDHTYSSTDIASPQHQRHNSTLSSKENNDHTYVRERHSSSSYDDHTYVHDNHTYVRQTAINQSVQDFNIVPNNNEQYDLLSFFANVTSTVTKCLRSRLIQNGIKWYFSVQTELTKIVDEEQTTKPHFRSRTYTSLNLGDYDQHECNEAFQKMFASFEKYIRESSGWILKKVLNLTVHTVIYSPLVGSSYMELPKKLRKSRSLLNIRNMDQKCFLWSCLASLHPSDSPLVSEYETYENEVSIEGLNFPMTINQISTFEKLNPTISVNVFLYEESEVIPLRITKHISRTHHINLLLLQSENNSHYILIKKFNSFLSTLRHGEGSYHFCYYCLHGFCKESSLTEHIPYCQTHGEQKIELPTEQNCFLQFKDFQKTLRVPYVIYADFETLNKPLNNIQSKSVTQTQLLEPCSFGYKIVSTDPDFQKDTVFYRGEDAPKKLIECLLRESDAIEKRLKDIKPLDLTHTEEMSFQKADKCYLCQKLFIETDKKARHHDHTSGKYIGATHTNCNLQCKQTTFIPVFMHNLSNFDAHLLCQYIGHFKTKRISCIPQTMEKYVSFTLGKLRFLDSFSFLSSSLQSLVNNLAKGETSDDINMTPFTHFKREIKDHTKLLLRKGVYMYEYMQSWDKFDETDLPPKSQFYSSLTKQHISDEDYHHAKHVFQVCECKTIGDYHDLYLRTDVLLLADVFENFRDTSLKNYGLDPCHFYTSPGLSWQAMLKMTKVCLELLTDIDQVLFIERAIRGGVSMICSRHAKANNSHVEGYNPSKETSYLAYYDVNNLYGYCMTQKLPVGFFRFLTIDEINAFDITKVSEDGSEGYIIECDLEYPSEKHDIHNDYPLAPIRKFIPNEDLSPYAQNILRQFYDRPTGELPPRTKVEKLLTTLEERTNYTLHYRNLQLYLQLGLKLKKVHKVLEFRQEAFMKPYIDFNTNMRQQAKSTFEKNFYKLMNNAVYGKTLEQCRNHRNVELCHTEKRMKKLTAKPTYKAHRIFSEDLVGVEFNRVKVKINKPIYVGMTILDLSKVVMGDLFYNKLRNIWPSMSLNMTDTDSFLVTIMTKDLFRDMRLHSDIFDTSNFPKDHLMYSNVNHMIPGKAKLENSHLFIKEFCGLKSKLYSYQCGNEDEKRAKGISKSVVNKEITFQHYKDTLFNKLQMKSTMNVLRSHDHHIYGESVTKVGLSCFDDKRYLLEDGITSLAYGHYKIPHK